MAEDEIKVSVVLVNKSQEFHLPIFQFLVIFLWQLACFNTPTIPFFILVSFFFEDFFEASTEQIIINGI